MDTLTKSCSPTIVITASGEVQTHEEATAYHLLQNNYSLDALQAYCFGINFKTVTLVISPGGDFLDLILNCNKK